MQDFTGTPWINPNYKINVADQLKNDSKLFTSLSKTHQAEKEYEIIVYGKYELLLLTMKIYAYVRTLGNQAW